MILRLYRVYSLYLNVVPFIILKWLPLHQKPLTRCFQLNFIYIESVTIKIYRKPEPETWTCSSGKIKLFDLSFERISGHCPSVCTNKIGWPMSIWGLSGGKYVKDSKEHAGKAMWIKAAENRRLHSSLCPVCTPDRAALNTHHWLIVCAPSRAENHAFISKWAAYAGEELWHLIKHLKITAVTHWGRSYIGAFGLKQWPHSNSHVDEHVCVGIGFLLSCVTHSWTEKFTFTNCLQELI